MLMNWVNFFKDWTRISQEKKSNIFSISLMKMAIIK